MKAYIVVKHSEEEESTALNPGYLDKTAAEKEIERLRAVGIAHNEWVCKRREYINNSKELAECIQVYEVAHAAYTNKQKEGHMSHWDYKNLNKAMTDALDTRTLVERHLKENFNSANPEPERDFSWYSLQEINIM